MIIKDYLVKTILEKLEKDNQSYNAIQNYLNYIDLRLQDDLKHEKYDNKTERHHILPRSLFPEYLNDKNNLVTLTLEQHIKVHQLLAYTGEYSCIAAYWSTTRIKKNKLSKDVIQPYFEESKALFDTVNGNPVVNLTEGIIFKSSCEAGRKYGLSNVAIINACKRQLITKKCYWCFASDLGDKTYEEKIEEIKQIRKQRRKGQAEKLKNYHNEIAENVINIHTGEVFGSITLANEHYGIRSISQAIHFKVRAADCFWMFEKDCYDREKKLEEYLEYERTTKGINRPKDDFNPGGKFIPGTTAVINLETGEIIKSMRELAKKYGLVTVSNNIRKHYKVGGYYWTKYDRSKTLEQQREEYFKDMKVNPYKKTE